MVVMRCLAGITGGIALLSATAMAADTAPCPAGMVCASNPRTVADALARAGYKASISTDDEGDPLIRSAASGYNFSVVFYGCQTGKACDALRFQVVFEDDGKNSAALANSWNVKKRFIHLAALEDGGLSATYDVTTRGGLTQANFADVVDWWDVMLGELSQFFKASQS